MGKVRDLQNIEFWIIRDFGGVWIQLSHIKMSLLGFEAGMTDLLGHTVDLRLCLGARIYYSFQHAAPEN